MEDLNGGETLLKELIKGLIVTNDWYQVKKRVSEKLFEYTKQSVKTGEAELDNLARPLRFQIMLDVVGPDIRELWGKEAEAEYKPELLREPYVQVKKAKDLRALASKVFTALVSKMLAVDKNNNGMMSSTKQRYIVSGKVRGQAVLDHKKKGGNAAAIIALSENVGSALTSMIREEDTLVRILATPLTPQSAYNSRKTDNSRGLYKLGSSATSSTAEDQGAQAVRAIVDRYDPNRLDSICVHLRGSLLSESLRKELWGYKYLTRTSVEAPHQAGSSAVHELARLTANKGYDVSSMKGLEKSNMYNMINSAVEAGISASLSLSIAAATAAATVENLGRPSSAGSEHDREGQAVAHSKGIFFQGREAGYGIEAKPATPFAILAGRARLLVHAVYALNDDFSSRIVLIAIMLMRVFPDEPPTGEIVLRLFQRITLECMPSEQLHHEYSLATVAHEAWSQLLKRDPELTHFLQNYGITNKTTNASASFAGNSLSTANGNGSASASNNTGEKEKEKEGIIPNGISNATIKSTLGPDNDKIGMEAPRSLVLLRGWLEDAFLGWVGEHTSIFLWDQLTLFGGCPASFKEMLPILCCLLLRAMRKRLLMLPPDQDIIASIRKFGRELRTRSVVEAVRCEPSFAKHAPPKQYMPEIDPDADLDTFVLDNTFQHSMTKTSNTSARAGSIKSSSASAPVPTAAPAPAPVPVPVPPLSTAVSALGMESAGNSTSSLNELASPHKDGIAGGMSDSPLVIDLGGLATKTLSREASAAQMDAVDV